MIVCAQYIAVYGSSYNVVCYVVSPSDWRDGSRDDRSKTHIEPLPPKRNNNLRLSAKVLQYLHTSSCTYSKFSNVCMYVHAFTSDVRAAPTCRPANEKALIYVSRVDVIGNVKTPFTDKVAFCHVGSKALNRSLRWYVW